MKRYSIDDDILLKGDCYGATFREKSVIEYRLYMSNKSKAVGIRIVTRKKI